MNDDDDGRTICGIQGNDLRLIGHSWRRPVTA